MLITVDKCAKCDSHARCDNGNCVCMEGWVGDGQTCTPKGGRKYPNFDCSLALNSKKMEFFFKEISINEIKFSTDIKSIPLKNAKRSPVRGQ